MLLGQLVRICISEVLRTSRGQGSTFGWNRRASLDSVNVGPALSLTYLILKILRHRLLVLMAHRFQIEIMVELCLAHFDGRASIWTMNANISGAKSRTTAIQLIFRSVLHPLSVEMRRNHLGMRVGLSLIQRGLV